MQLTKMTSKIAGFMLQMNQFMLNSLMGDNREINTQEVQAQKSSCQEQSQLQTKQYQIKTVRAIKMKPKTKQIIQNDKPKGPTSSFLIYYHQNKIDLAKKFGEVNVSKLTKLASQEWKNLPEKQREEYLKKSEQSKKRYQKQMEIYKQKNAEKLKQETKKKRIQYRNKWMNKKKAKQTQAKESDDLISQINSELKLSQEGNNDAKYGSLDLIKNK